MNNTRPARQWITSGVTAALFATCSTVEQTPIETQTGAISLPSGFVEDILVSGLDAPTAMAFAPDGRLFVAEQEGTLRVVQDGSLLATPFISLTVDQQGERGLLGLAFDPAFSSNNLLYLYYTTPTPAVHNRLSRFTANGNLVVPGSEVVLLDLDNLTTATNHNGGAIHFGLDGKLYVAVGENASPSNAQSMSNILGKMLRLNADGSIPSDNPFFNTASGNRRAIWALGLRNPFTFAVQPVTGTMLINDVGQSSWEEINLGVAGANYGWPATEGATTDSSFRAPLHTYGHGQGNFTGCAITGGAFYNPATTQFPSSYVGKYFFADLCSHWIRVYDPATTNVSAFATATTAGVVDLQVGNDGALYYASRSPGRVNRIRSASVSQAPVITTQPQSQSSAVGQTATFTVAATGSAPLSYQWQRNGGNIAGATAINFTTATLAATDNGATYRVVVTNATGNVTSAQATLTVTTNPNTPPSGNITSPVQGTTYAAGTTITYVGSGSDAQDGTLGGAAFRWEVVFHHDTHTHPVVPPTSGSNGGSFVIANRGETATNVFYRIHLTVTDAAGASTSTFRDVTPRVANLNLQSDPTGLQVTLDGQPVATPSSIASVVGVIRTLGVVTPQTQSGSSYAFASWTDGGAATHEFTTPAVATTYQARFIASGSGGGLRGEYFDNSNLTTSRIVRTDARVNFDWGNNAPDASIGADTFSVRWTGKVTPRFSETYRFYTVSDDGVRLWVNGVLLIDNWTDHGATEDSQTIALNAGQAYDIKMEFFESGGLAVAKLLWSSASEAKQVIPASQLSAVASVGTGLVAAYYDNRDFTNLKVSRTDAQLNFDWGSGSPDPLLGADDFSVRWMGEVTPTTNETYTIFTTSDDGIRVWIEGQLVIDNFTDHAPTENSANVTFTAGQSYDVKVEFYERGGGAVARLSWQSPTIAKQVIPSARLSPLDSSAMVPPAF